MFPANKKSPARNISFAFDVGHSSIGWAVLKSTPTGPPELMGCGTVIFQADDCLASQRRIFRRQRRHIRATRQRISRLRRLIGNLGVLSAEQLERPGYAWPWLLAARVLRGGKALTWVELWDVLRWYAHNRGYDGNKGWSRHELASDEDTEKEQKANELLSAFQKKHGRAGTMAEVFCDVLGLDPLGKIRSSMKRGRNLGAAFPRGGVEREVERILRAHVGILPHVDNKMIEAVMRDHTALPGPGFRLPERYGQRLANGSLSPGGLLFGQLVPRFDNRIIARCPITFERVYQRVKAEGGGKERAKHEAEKLAKVPGTGCAEFHRFRWAMQLANVNVEVTDSRTPRNLTVIERCVANEEMEKHGFLTKRQFKDIVRQQTDGAPDNLDRLLSHPDAECALVLDPVRRYIHSDSLVSALWPALPDALHKRLSGQWRRGRVMTVAEVLAACDGARVVAEAAARKYLDGHNTKKRKKDEPVTWEALLRTKLSVKRPSGRAPHTREVMGEVVDFVLSTNHHPAEGSNGAVDNGPLFRSEAIRVAQLQRALDEQTNNHLVRHRLKILERLHEDLIKQYAQGERERVGRITIEVNRDVREMSGKTAQEQAKLQGQMLANFKGVRKKLEAAYEGLGIHVGQGLIRKGRVAEDLGWTCPYTGKTYDALDLLHRRVDKDHIIPRSDRASDSLDSLVITFAEVNKMKGKRTALSFIEEYEGKPVEGMPNVYIKSLATYLKDVDALETRRGHDNDQRRKKNRKRLLLLRDYVEKEFTPADLTQTSQLVRLGAQTLQKHYAGVEKQLVITSLPGSVTGAVRKSWNLTGCLATANPQVLDAEGRPRIKTEIRGITHLHHALDACVLAFASLLLPRDGGAWELLVKRRLNLSEQRCARELFGPRIEITQEGELRLAELPNALKEQVRQRLAERRVVQHIPADLSGLRCKETVWRVFDPADPHPNSRRLARWLAQSGVVIPAADAKTVLIICRKRKNADARDEGDAAGKVFHDEGKTWRWVYAIKDKTALLGLFPEGEVADAKLKRIKAVKVLGDNFGLALDPEPTLIRSHKIWHQLQTLRKTNQGKQGRLLRKGSLIRIRDAGSRSNYRGVWMVRGLNFKQRDGFIIGLAPTDYVKDRRIPGVIESASLLTLLKSGLEILKPPLCGLDFGH